MTITNERPNPGISCDRKWLGSWTNRVVGLCVNMFGLRAYFDSAARRLKA
jgi:hypothetical protein